MGRRPLRTCQVCGDKRTANRDAVCDECRESFQIEVPNDGYCTVRTDDVALPEYEVGDSRKGTGFRVIERDGSQLNEWRPYP